MYSCHILWFLFFPKEPAPYRLQPTVTLFRQVPLQTWSSSQNRVPHKRGARNLSLDLRALNRNCRHVGFVHLVPPFSQLGWLRRAWPRRFTVGLCKAQDAKTCATTATEGQFLRSAASYPVGSYLSDYVCLPSDLLYYWDNNSGINRWDN